MLQLQSCAVEDILPVRRALRRELLEQPSLRDLRIAVLGGSTTTQFVNMLELLLLANGFRPVFHESEYGRYFEDAVLDPQALVDFAPDIVVIHTSCLNIQTFPPVNCSEADLAAYVAAELDRFQQMWASLAAHLSCHIVQNNFELPPDAVLGNRDAVSPGGRARFVSELNVAMVRAASALPKLHIQDVHGLAARLGLRHWFDLDRYFSYKLLLQPNANLELARSLASIIGAVYGKSRKVLVLDLDNTLWGGVIGDDGIDHIRIGRETPEAEAFTAFQEYCLRLRERGVLLAVCSKNNHDIALAGLQHPDSVLRPEHISCFKANWEPKHENILAIADELNLGVDSFVFIDDNPAERAIVAAQLPAVAVPDIGSEVTQYIARIEAGRYFEPGALSAEDFARAGQYADNAQRSAQVARFADYGEYLDSLEMSAEIDDFKPVYMERIAQLTNKTNQFNLTTRRYTLAELESAARAPETIALYGKLSDRFGDNGLISVVLGRIQGRSLDIDLWLMSCRVLKRGMEQAMLDALVERARARGVHTIGGVYLPTPKNGLVADHYTALGFTQCPAAADLLAGAAAYTLAIADYTPRNKHIGVLETTHA